MWRRKQQRKKRQVRKRRGGERDGRERMRQRQGDMETRRASCAPALTLGTGAGRDWPPRETLQPAIQSHKNTSTPKTGSERMPDRQRDQGCFHVGDQPSSWPIPAPGHQGGLQPAATSNAHSGPSPPYHSFSLCLSGRRVELTAI